MRIKILLFIFLFCLLPAVFGAKVVFNKACLDEVLSLINSAKNDLSISIFDINQPQIIDAILQAHFRGVKIRILGDRRQGQGQYSRALDLYVLGLDVRLNSKRRIHHHKFAVADGKRSVSGSFNWTRSASTANAEDLTVLKAGVLPNSETQAVRDFGAKFDEDWIQNSGEKSEGYFKAALEVSGKEVKERWDPWTKTTLQKDAAKTPSESRQLNCALQVASRFHAKDPEWTELIAPHAKPGRKAALSTRVAALRFLGNSGTDNPSHHRLIQIAGNDTNPLVKDAAFDARVALGEGFTLSGEFKGVGGNLRAIAIYCESLMRTIGLR